MGMVTVTRHRPMEEAIRDFMKARIAQEAQKVADEYKEKALKDLDEAIRKAVTDTAVHFSRMIQVYDGGEKLTIQIMDERKG